MALIKNLFKYLLILIVIVLLAVSLMAGIMFFFPNASIFGFRYLSNHKENGGYINGVLASDITEINVETENYDIVIMPNSLKDVPVNDSFSIVVENKYSGFSNKKVDEISIDGPILQTKSGKKIAVKDFTKDNLHEFKTGTSYSLKLIEPTGLVSYGSSRVVVYMPENIKGAVYNLKTKTGDISFAKNTAKLTETLQTADITLDIASFRGSFNLDNAKMMKGSSLTVSNYLGKVDINSEQIGNVIINSNSGNFTFKNIGFEDFAGSLTINGNNPYVRVDTVYGNVNFDTTTGFLQAKEIKGDGIIKTENGIIRINKALSGLTVSNNSGETTIDQIGESVASTKSVTIQTKSGKISLGGSETTESKGVYYLSKISSESGRVVVNNMYATGLSETSNIIETTKGSVEVDFGTSTMYKNLKITTTSGAITLKNIYGQIEAKTGKSSKIYAEFTAIAHERICNFETDEGTIELVVPAPTNSTDKQFVLEAQNKQNKLDVQIGDFSKKSFDAKADGEIYYSFEKTFPEGESTLNTIKAKTNSGNIVVREK